MSTDACMLLLHARTPIHVGVDQGLGAIDLPTMRAVHTGDPLIPGSSLKGVLRDLAESDPNYSRDAKVAPRDPAYQRKVESAFGPPQERAGDFQGGLIFGDALILALPVRSLSGTFAWVTCRRLMRRFNEDAKTAGVAELAIPAASAALNDDEALGTTTSGLAVDPAARERKVFLEELLFTMKADNDLDLAARTLGDLLWPDDAEARADLARRLLLVPDDLFSFYARTALEVRARVKLNDETGTAAASGPWTEEHMPAETLLASLVLGRQTLHKTREGKDGQPTKVTRADGVKALAELIGSGARTLRLGGHATIGLGRASLRLVGGGR